MSSSWAGVGNFGGSVGSVGGAASSSSGVEGGGVGGGALGSRARSSVLVVDDSEGDDQPIVSRPASSSACSNVRFLMTLDCAMGRRMVEYDEFVRTSDNRVVWHLAPLGQNIVDWAIAYINNILARAYVKAFYFGITARLQERWLGAPARHGFRRLVGHKEKGWQRMTLLAASHLPDEIGDAEKSVLAKFRRWGRGGYFNVEGHPLCANRNPGGEGARAGSPPHILYCCVSWNPRPRSP